MKYVAIGRKVFKVSNKEGDKFIETMSSSMTDLDCNQLCVDFMKGKKPWVILDTHVGDCN